MLRDFLSFIMFLAIVVFSHKLPFITVVMVSHLKSMACVADAKSIFSQNNLRPDSAVSPFWCRDAEATYNFPIPRTSKVSLRESAIAIYITKLENFLDLL